MEHVIDTAQIEADIEKAMSLLQEKANQYTPEQWAHYVVKGENEEEDGSCETFCEKCIDKAIANADLRYRKKRARLQLLIRDLERFGYVVRLKWNNEYQCKALMMQHGGAKEIKQLKKQIREEFPDTTFSYRYYQLDSTTSHEHCDLCGEIIRSCVTADEQEIEHWESLDDSDFIIADMSEYLAYEVYGILEFIHQAKKELYYRGHAIALKIIALNDTDRTH